MANCQPLDTGVVTARSSSSVEPVGVAPSLTNQSPGVSQFKGPVHWRLKWETPLGHEIGSAPVVDAQGHLYLAVGTKIWSLGTDGQVQWTHDFVASKHAHPYGAGRGAFPSASPALSADGLLFQPVGAIYLLAHMLGLHTQAPAHQHLAWALETKSLSRSSPLIVDDITYTTTEGALFAIHRDGKLVWQSRGPFYLNSSPALTHDRTQLLVGGSDGNVLAIERATGKMAWKAGRRANASLRLPERDVRGKTTRQFTTEGHIPECPAIGADGTIYIGSWDGFLKAFDPQGHVRWSLDLGDRLTSAPAVTSQNEVLISSFEGTLFKVRVIDNKPQIAWQVEANARYSSPLVTADGQVLVGTLDGQLRSYSLNDGTFIQNIRLLRDWGAIVGSPVPGADGVIYLGGQDGTLRAIE